MVNTHSLSESGAVDWSKYLHVMIEAHAVTTKNHAGFELLDIEKAILSPQSVTTYALYGLDLEGRFIPLCEADTLTEATKAVTEGIEQINKIHSIDVISNAMRKRYFWDFDFNVSLYDDIESRGVALITLADGSHTYEETDQDNANCFSVYGHLEDPEIGGCDCLATVYSVAEMAQISRILDSLIE